MRVATAVAGRNSRRCLRAHRPAAPRTAAPRSVAQKTAVPTARLVDIVQAVMVHKAADTVADTLVRHSTCGSRSSLSARTAEVLMVADAQPQVTAADAQPQVTVADVLLLAWAAA